MKFYEWRCSATLDFELLSVFLKLVKVAKVADFHHGDLLTADENRKRRRRGINLGSVKTQI